MISDPPDIWIIPQQGDTKPKIEMVITYSDGKRQYEKIELNPERYYLTKNPLLNQIKN